VSDMLIEIASKVVLKFLVFGFFMDDLLRYEVKKRLVKKTWGLL
jgi:hypothetical protein